MTQDASPDALRAQLKTLRARLKHRASACQDALERLADLGRGPGALSSLTRLQRASQALSGLDPEALGVDPSPLRDLVDDALSSLRATLRRDLVGGLELAARDAALPFKLLTEHPLTLALSPLTVTLDLSAAVAHIAYARETILETPLGPQEILDGRARAMDLIRDAAVPPERFFDLARQAYDMARAAQAAPPGARVDLVDLLAPLALLQIDRARWRHLDWSTVSPYPRALLAYQLSKLQRARALTQKNERLELGAATTDSTRDKKNVLFVPSSASDGQYYLSVRVISR